MFSKKERDFLTLVLRRSPPGSSSELEATFPTPGYRRKIRWTIRRKVVKAAADWELYSRAIRQEPGILPASGSPAKIPLHADPLVAALVRVEQRLHRGPPRRPPPSTEDAR